MGRDITGERFGRLVVLRRVENKVSPKGFSKPQYECLCDCGTIKKIVKDNLISGGTASCGCYKKEKDHERFLVHGFAEKPDKLYQKWSGMRSRCYNPNAIGYKNYGGRGIKVCAEWDDYGVFRKWAIDNGYKEGLTIDRIDVDGNYEPSNCRFTTTKEQNNNRRTTNFHTYNGKTQSEMKWAEEYGISYGALKTRLENGWEFERALTSPVVHNEILIEYNGQTHPLKRWARIYGMCPSTVKGRMDRGWSFEEAISTPPKEAPFKTLLFEYKGESHTVSEWSKLTGIPYNTIKNRIKKGLDMHNVLHDPVKNREYISREE